MGEVATPLIAFAPLDAALTGDDHWVAALLFMTSSIFLALPYFWNGGVRMEGQTDVWVAFGGIGVLAIIGFVIAWRLEGKQQAADAEARRKRQSIDAGA